MTHTSLRYRGKKLFYLQACCDIQKGEQLGINYGLSYWLTKGRSPRFFYKNGTVINTEVYLLPLAQIVSKYHVTNNSILLPDKNLALRKQAANGDLENVIFFLEYEANINEVGIETGRIALH